VAQKAPIVVLSQNFTVSAVRMTAPSAITAAETQAMIKAFGDEQKEVVNRVSFLFADSLIYVLLTNICFLLSYFSRLCLGF
jgi:hypothetical protein